MTLSDALFWIALGLGGLAIAIGYGASWRAVAKALTSPEQAIPEPNPACGDGSSDTSARSGSGVRSPDRSSDTGPEPRPRAPEGAEVGNVVP